MAHGNSLSVGLGVVTTIGTPGADTNVPTENRFAPPSPLSEPSRRAAPLVPVRILRVLLTGGVANDCAKWDSNGNISDAGLPCSNGNFPSLAGGTNTFANFVVGTGASIAPPARVRLPQLLCPRAVYPASLHPLQPIPPTPPTLPAARFSGSASWNSGHCQQFQWQWHQICQRCFGRHIKQLRQMGCQWQHC